MQILFHQAKTETNTHLVQQMNHSSSYSQSATCLTHALQRGGDPHAIADDDCLSSTVIKTMESIVHVVESIRLY